MAKLWNAIVLFAGLAMAAGSQAQVTATPEEVKAAFIYQFAAFVEWPASAPRREAFIVGVAGDERIGAELRRISASREVLGRPVRVVEVASAADAANLDILFIGREFAGAPAPLIRAALARHTLVVSDIEDGLAHGSIINFDTRERVRFEISLDSAQKAGLRLSSRLLSVAVRVRKGDWESYDEPLYA